MCSKLGNQTHTHICEVNGKTPLEPPSHRVHYDSVSQACTHARTHTHTLTHKAQEVAVFHGQCLTVSYFMNGERELNIT